MSHPAPGKDYSDELWAPDITCPYCHAQNQEAEDLGDHPSYLSGTCDTCNRDFSVDILREEYYNEKGDVIK